MATVLSIDGGKKILEANHAKFPDAEVDEAWFVQEMAKDPSNDGLSYELIDDKDIVAARKKAAAAKALLAYKEDRMNEYPAVGDVIDALYKKEAGDSTEWDALGVSRDATKKKYPKE
jgi:hypothetical protein